MCFVCRYIQLGLYVDVCSKWHIAFIGQFSGNIIDAYQSEAPMLYILCSMHDLNAQFKNLISIWCEISEYFLFVELDKPGQAPSSPLALFNGKTFLLLIPIFSVRFHNAIAYSRLVHINIEHCLSCSAIGSHWFITTMHCISQL